MNVRGTKIPARPFKSAKGDNMKQLAVNTVMATLRDTNKRGMLSTFVNRCETASTVSVATSPLIVLSAVHPSALPNITNMIGVLVTNIESSVPWRYSSTRENHMPVTLDWKIVIRKTPTDMYANTDGLSLLLATHAIKAIWGIMKSRLITAKRVETKANFQAITHVARIA